MATPVQCSSDVTLIEIFSHKSDDILKGIKNPDFFCYLQTPPELKGKEPAGYPYFDFDAAQAKNTDLPASSSSAGIFPSSPVTSVMCVDMGNGIDFTSQSFTDGLFMPLFFFFMGVGISAIFKVIRSI